ncbi:MAG: DEAD/DEAH box helicase [Bacteroidetes bacterium]|nr:DEAD/DEAH box helicase [Bacteroidota bacterium]
MIYDLYEYQKKAKSEIRGNFSNNIKSVVLCLPTGGGKTVTFADMAREAVLNGFRVGIVVDRKELLDQAKEKLISYGLNPSIITAGRTGKTGAKTYVATVQTLVRRVIPEVNLWIIDEAHKQIFDKLFDLPQFQDVFVIGATATPYRTGKMNQLSDYYGKIVETTSISELIQSGFLCPAITYGAKVDTSKIQIKRGDYDTQELYQAFDKATLYAGVVDKYKKFSSGTKAIVFNINVEHSKKTTEAFNNAGISAVHLDGNTPKAERARILEAYHKGLFMVLNNVGVLTAGFDEWTIETVIVNLATKSLTKWLQMCGRGARITPKNLQGVQGYLQKEHFVIIDMGGNVFNLGFWEQEREYSLTHKAKDTTDAAPVRICIEDKYDKPPVDKITQQPTRLPQLGCGAILHASAPTCKFCGYIFERKKSEPKEADFIQLENYDSLPVELVGVSWGSMSIKELEKVRKIRGYKIGWIAKQIIMNKDLELIDYARFRNFKSGAAWVERMERMYIK